MRYSIKYLTMAPIVEERDGIMCGHGKRPCCVCGRPTRYIDIDFEVHVCSDKCRQKYTDEYMQMIRKSL